MTKTVEYKAPTNATFSLLALQHSITLADQKSGLMLAAMTALLTFMAREVNLEGHLPDWAAIASAALLLITLVLNFFTVRPTLLTNKDHSLSFWRSPLFDLGEAEFVARSLSAEFEQSHGRDDVLHLRALALVNRRKYALLRLAFITGGFGVLGFLLWRLGL